MKALLVQPPNYTGNELDNYLGGCAFRSPQLGLLYLAACARSHHDIRVLDLNHLQSGYGSAGELFQLVEKEVESFQPELVGYYTMANVYPWVIQSCERLKKAHPDMFLILGGEQASLTAKDSLAAFPFVDAIARGEGEATFPELLAFLEAGRPLDGLHGLSFRRNGDCLHNPDRSMESDLDRIPLPAYEFTPPLPEYQPGQPIHRANIITSRGCPYDCKFCSVQVFWERRVRFRTHARVIEELRYLQNQVGAGFIDFADDTFTINIDHTREFCHEVLRAGLDLEWFCRSRVDRVDLEILKLLRQAGCTLMFYGAESGSQEMLEYVGKKILREQILEAVRVTVAAGIKPILSFIYGYPDETPKNLETSVAFSRRCLEEGAYWVSFQRLTALPGTPIASRITRRFDVGGAYVGGSDLLRHPDYLESIQPMVRAHPSVFPSYFTVETTGFRSESHLQETYHSLAARYGLKTNGGTF